MMKLMKPCIKLCHNVIDTASGDICIGELPDCGLIIKKAPEWVRILIKKLDGKRTLPRIKKEMIISFPDLADNAIEKFIDKLHSNSLLEDAANLPSVLSHKEAERYNRQMLQFSVIDKEKKSSFVYQERLKGSTVTILGMGGWGTWCALQLALLGIGNIRIVDGDDVELTNINRQVLYSDKDIGEQKVEVAKKKLENINPHVNIISYDEFVTRDEKRLAELLGESNLVILAWASLGYFRKNTVEEKVHLICSQKGIKLMELGGDPIDITIGPIFPYDGQQQIYPNAKKNQIENYYSHDNHIREIQESRMKQSYLNGDRVVNAWQSAPSLATMSGLVADQVVKLLTKYDDCCLVGKRFHLSMRDFSSHIEDVFEYE